MTFLFSQIAKVSDTPEHEADPTLAAKLTTIADDYNERTHKLSATERQRLVNMIVSLAKSSAEKGAYRCVVRLKEITRDDDRVSYPHWGEPDQRVLKEVREKWHLNIDFSDHISDGACSVTYGYRVSWPRPLLEAITVVKRADAADATPR
jgi:hypothetical protein